MKVGIPVVEGAIAQISGVALCAVVPVYEARNLWNNGTVNMCGTEEKMETHTDVHEIKQVIIDALRINNYMTHMTEWLLPWVLVVHFVNSENPISWRASLLGGQWLLSGL